MTNPSLVNRFVQLQLMMAVLIEPIPLECRAIASLAMTSSDKCLLILGAEKEKRKKLFSNQFCTIMHWYIYISMQDSD